MESPSTQAASLSEDKKPRAWGSPQCPNQYAGRLQGAECTERGAMEKARQQWSNPLQFLLICVSYAVGLGNVWRFPYLCQMYGGGSFLVPYIIMLILEGMPLLYMELAVGQRMQQGSIGAWRTISPYLSGIGTASLVVSFLVAIYYNVINSWAFWYLLHSFQDPLPWSVCPLNDNLTGYDEECEKASSTQYFWYRKTLNISPSIQNNGGVQWEPALCLSLVWLMVYLCILRGTESTGKVVYFTTSLPYCVLIIYLVRGLTLHGASNGLVYMFTPKVEQLANPKAWISAATQIFFSLGLGCGGLIAFASYNEPSNDCQKHAIIVIIINSTTAIFSSIVTFSIYGFKATFNYENCLSKQEAAMRLGNLNLSSHECQADGLLCRVILLLTNSFDLEDGFLTASNLEPMKDYLASTYPSKYSEVFPHIRNCSLESELNTAVQGTGLAFIVYTEAIKNMEVSQLWSVLYFFMLLTLGLVCLVSCAIGMVFTMEAGNYWFDIFNDYAATLSLLLIVLVEIIAVCYIYGLRRFESDLQAMTGSSLNWYWKAMWAGVCPLLIIGLFVFYVSDYALAGTLKYHAWDATQGHVVSKDYPSFAVAVIGLLVASSIMCIPLVALGTFITCHLKRRPKNWTSPRLQSASHRCAASTYGGGS
uniref:sodium- and chloride-dependent transporter XTRP3A-like isoform X3 n=1 Tax=Jaculus jaculus TaxID=51337 RepID=UPI001E1B326D|nr:sodium- and chloride-dependent transporter XTRP3A-like isoform X3 [Jaculus jaculus]